MRSQIEVLSRQRQALVASLERVASSKSKVVPPVRAVPLSTKQESVMSSDAYASNGLNGIEIGVVGDGPLASSDTNGPSSQEAYGAAIRPSESCARCEDWSQTMAPEFRRKVVRAFVPNGTQTAVHPTVVAPSHTIHRIPYGLSDSKKRRRAAENNLLTR
jgi:hypothetical protein